MNEDFLLGAGLAISVLVLGWLLSFGSQWAWTRRQDQKAHKQHLRRLVQDVLEHSEKWALTVVNELEFDYAELHIHLSTVETLEQRCADRYPEVHAALKQLWASHRDRLPKAILNRNEAKEWNDRREESWSELLALADKEFGPVF